MANCNLRKKSSFNRESSDVLKLFYIKKILKLSTFQKTPCLKEKETDKYIFIENCQFYSKNTKKPVKKNN